MLAGRDVDIYTYEAIWKVDYGDYRRVTVYAETGELEVHAPITAATGSTRSEDDRIDINAALAVLTLLTSMNGDILCDTGTVMPRPSKRTPAARLTWTAS